MEKKPWLALFADDVEYEDPPGTFASHGKRVMSEHAWDGSFTEHKRWILDPVLIIECANEAQVHMRNYGAVAGVPFMVESIELWRVNDEVWWHQCARSGKCQPTLPSLITWRSVDGKVPRPSTDRRTELPIGAGRAAPERAICVQGRLPALWVLRCRGLRGWLRVLGVSVRRRGTAPAGRAPFRSVGLWWLS
jgi:hypothetical protein